MAIFSSQSASNYESEPGSLPGTDRGVSRTVNAGNVGNVGNAGSTSATAGPLALAVICLIVYASLYPFTDWRDQNISPFRFLTAPFPKYWTGFDVGANLLGYAPLGFLLTLTLSTWRSKRLRWAVSVAVLTSAMLSLSMETLQSYLPSRIASNLDLALNTAGACSGAFCAWVLEKAGVIRQWTQFKARWFAPDARGSLVLLILWPIALLFPAAVPMGLGQVFERLEFALSSELVDTPFLEWMPVRDLDLQPLVPIAELLCVSLGALIPCLIGYGVIRALAHRAVFAAVTLAAAVGVSGLSAALTYGPAHAWNWLDAPVQVGLCVTVVMATLLLTVPQRVAAALAVLALTTHLGLLNQAPENPYFAQTLQTWEQGRFIRFHGLIQWLGWLWPYAALAYVMTRLCRREHASTM